MTKRELFRQPSTGLWRQALWLVISSIISLVCTIACLFRLEEAPDLTHVILFHRLDGIFVGTAFLNCNRDLAIAISAATIYHEIAQEIADYFMFTRFCNIPPRKALIINFVNGFSVLCGAIMIVAMGKLSDLAIGSILAVSSGVYFYISVAECFPRAKEAHKTFRDAAISLLAFVVGVVPIGLVLLNHGHCESGH